MNNNYENMLSMVAGVFKEQNDILKSLIEGMQAQEVGPTPSFDQTMSKVKEAQEEIIASVATPRDIDPEEVASVQNVESLIEPATSVKMKEDFCLNDDEYKLNVKMIKDETTYSLMDDMTSSHFTPGYGLDATKNQTLQATQLQIKVTQDKNYHRVYSVYNEDVFLGIVPTTRESLKLVAQLEFLVDKTVTLDATLRSAQPNSIFTIFTVRIVDIQDTVSASIIEEPKSASLLGEMNLDSLPVFL